MVPADCFGESGWNFSGDSLSVLSSPLHLPPIFGCYFMQAECAINVLSAGLTGFLAGDYYELVREGLYEEATINA